MRSSSASSSNSGYLRGDVGFTAQLQTHGGSSFMVLDGLAELKFRSLPRACFLYTSVLVT